MLQAHSLGSTRVRTNPHMLVRSVRLVPFCKHMCVYTHAYIEVQWFTKVITTRGLVCLAKIHGCSSWSISALNQICNMREDWPMQYTYPHIIKVYICGRLLCPPPLFCGTKVQNSSKLSSQHIIQNMPREANYNSSPKLAQHTIFRWLDTTASINFVVYGVYSRAASNQGRHLLQLAV